MRPCRPRTRQSLSCASGSWSARTAAQMRGPPDWSKPTVASQTCRLRWVRHVRASTSDGRATVRSPRPGALHQMTVSCCHKLPGAQQGHCCSSREGGCFGVSLGLPSCMSASSCCIGRKFVSLPVSLRSSWPASALGDAPPAVPPGPPAPLSSCKHPSGDVCHRQSAGAPAASWVVSQQHPPSLCKPSAPNCFNVSTHLLQSHLNSSSTSCCRLLFDVDIPLRRFCKVTPVCQTCVADPPALLPLGLLQRLSCAAGFCRV